MDGHQNHGQPERLEDQIRRMLLSSSANTAQQTHPEAKHPVDHLPPPSQHLGPHHSQHSAPPQYHTMPPHQQVPGSGYPTDSRPPPNGSSGLYGHADAYQDQHRHWPPNTGPPPQFQHHRGNRGRGHRGHHHFHGPPHLGPHSEGPQFGPPYHGQRARHHQNLQLDPDAYHRSGPPQGFQRSSGSRNLYDPNQRNMPMNMANPERDARQARYLELLANSRIRNTEMTQQEHDEKDAFRLSLQGVLHDVCATDPEHLPDVSLQCFGSFQSGFATKGSDMDLVIVGKGDSSIPGCFSLLEADLPRVLEKRLLELGYGARLLSKTRVPIIKICDQPGQSLLGGLRKEREKWEALPEKEKYPHLYPEQDEEPKGANQEQTTAVTDAEVATVATHPQASGDVEKATVEGAQVSPLEAPQPDTSGDVVERTAEAESTSSGAVLPTDKSQSVETPGQAAGDAPVRQPNNRRERGQNGQNWTRERKAGPLDFPKEGVGIQCDINFFNPLGLHNTQMLRCYSICDARVRPMVLFVKAWAKCRKINSSYSGTLSSYGYVLMVLHYLVNVADPPVLPNLQSSWRPEGNSSLVPATPEEVNGWHVDFWRNEEEIKIAAQQGQLTTNTQPLGALIAGFFQYYASQQGGVQFRWMQEVLSLRSPRGILTKEEKGWVKAVTEQSEGRRVQQRYLFCVEDPFELNHNVARTVTHNGIVAIRDEFRRARRILQAIGNGLVPRDGELFAALLEAQDFENATAKLVAESNQDPSVAGDMSNHEEPVSGFPHGKRGHGHHHHGHHQQQQHEHGQHHRRQHHHNQQNIGMSSVPINVHDDAAFPSLTNSPGPRGGEFHGHGRGRGRGLGRGGGRGGFRRGRGDGQHQRNGDFAAHGDVDQASRLNAEEQAGNTAIVAANAVLADQD